MAMLAGEAEPQAWSSAVSTATDLPTAIEQVCKRALAGLPPGTTPDLAILHVSSIYGGPEVLQNVLKGVREHAPGVRALVGGGASGVVGMRKGRPVEVENDYAVQLTLAVLPGVTVQPFHVHPENVPAPEVGHVQIQPSPSLPELSAVDPVFLLYPAPSFMSSLDDFLAGIDTAHPGGLKFGALASTVSSLSKAHLFAWGDDGVSGITAQDFAEGTEDQDLPWLFNSGVVGVALSGDIRARSYITQGARPLGPAYICDRVDKSTIFSIRIAPPANPDGVPGPAMPPLAAIRQLQQASFNPPLQQAAPEAEAAAIQRSLLVGTEANALPNSPLQVKERVEGFTDRLMDGSITLPGPDLRKGQRLQFFIRDGPAAAADLDSTLAAYKRLELEASLRVSLEAETASGSDQQPSSTADDASAPQVPAPARFQATGVLMYPCFDRGHALYREKGYESARLAGAVPRPTGGFFCNGVIGPLCPGAVTSLFGSSTGFVVFSPKTARPFSPVELAAAEEGDADEEELDTVSDADDAFSVERRDIGSGRAVTSGPVQYSVAENRSRPRSTLEAMVWAKETEVDRARDRMAAYNRVPANAVRDLRSALATASPDAPPFPLVAEVKCRSPGGLEIRAGGYTAAALAQDAERGGAAAVAVQTDSVFFGGAAEDLAAVKAAVGVPVLWMDLVVYVYQLYQARLDGADAVRLVAAALPTADLSLFHKVATKIGMQAVVTVSSEKHLLAALAIDGVRLVSITQRDLATWELDPERAARLLGSDQPDTQCAARLLDSDQVKAALAKAGPDLVLMVEGGVKEALAKAGPDLVLMVEGGVDSSAQVQELRALGVKAVLVGEALLKQTDVAAAVAKIAGA
ncbi:hypothetical protein JKP88DRAFT_347307 [Tribonema minus]|uniref:indole-3-glycerol-phosphate synthase n=1 Tax=Tribonema minus TaxID=303371 RepID=A0A835ZFI7_9STRA|nr:hypothetical protein JKP88DRAFT_347307 [Tribonema minus]